MRKAFCLCCILVLASGMGVGVTAGTADGGGGGDGCDPQHGHVCDPHQHPHGGGDGHGDHGDGHGDHCRCAEDLPKFGDVEMCLAGGGLVEVCLLEIAGCETVPVNNAVVQELRNFSRPGQCDSNDH